MRRCPQCYLPKDPSTFRSEKRGAMCSDCREKYRGWTKRPLEEKRRLRVVRPGLRTSGELRVLVTLHSKNRKLGPIPATTSTAETCPPSCEFFGRGCYAEFHLQRTHWRKAQTRGLPWSDFLAWVQSLPGETLWRHNVAGDLPGEGDSLDPGRLVELFAAARGTRGFTFTHKPLREPLERFAVNQVNRPGTGLVVNLSGSGLAEADRLASLGIGPVAVVVPEGTRTGDRTPAGRRVVVCPAQTAAKLSCDRCRLCAIPRRRGIVGFLPHGQSAAEVASTVATREDVTR